MPRRLFEPEHESFRDSFRAFVAREILPHYAEWETARMVSRQAWIPAGSHGFLCLDVPEAYGGGGVASGGSNESMKEIIGRKLATGD